jgi:2-methylcitrate dehydratase PrpD
MNESRVLATWAAQSRYASLPQHVRQQTKVFLLDNLGCQIAGATLPWSRAFHKVVCGTRSGTHSTVVHFGGKLAPDDAAFLNSAFNHANEMDDTHFKSPTHPGGIAVPAALAMCEYAHGTGEQLLLAIAIAYEVQIRIAWACSPHLSKRGHHPPVGVGPFGAAVAAGILLGFDEERMLNALGIAGSHSAGISEYTRSGGSVKRIHSAIPAQAGVRSALFADAGITGPASVLEGEKGFFNVFAGTYDRTRLLGDLGTTYHLLDTGLKPHACPHFMQAALDAIDALRDKHRVGPDNLAAITVYASEAVLSHVCAITEPQDVLSAQFSLPFSLAMRLHHGGRGVHGGNGFWDYPKVDVHDDALLSTARRIRRYDASGPARLAVEQGIGLEV